MTLTNVITALERALPGQVERDASSAARTTYRCGGSLAALVRADTEADLSTIASVVPADVPVLVIGRGSNLLVADTGYDGIALDAERRVRTRRARPRHRSCGRGRGGGPAGAGAPSRGRRSRRPRVLRRHPRIRRRRGADERRRPRPADRRRARRRPRLRARRRGRPRPRPRGPPTGVPHLGGPRPRRRGRGVVRRAPGRPRVVR